jgi:hypothetical protein
MSDFTDTVSCILPGFGSPAQRLSTFDNVQTAGTSTYTLTFAPGLRRGYMRFRTKGSTATPPAQPTTGVTTTSFKVTASDGTRTYIISGAVGGVGAANETFDYIKSFNLDIVATTFVLTLITAVGNVDVDFEVSGGNSPGFVECVHRPLLGEGR